MKPLLLSFLIGWATVDATQAQNPTQQANKTTDEAIIRELIDRQNKDSKDTLPLTKNTIFVRGGMPKPMTRSDVNESSRKDFELMMSQRLNYVMKADVQRLVVAQAGDMAYEYSRGSLNWDTTDHKHVSFEVSWLRVWLKTEGKWKVDAWFARPDDTK